MNEIIDGLRRRGWAVRLDRDRRTARRSPRRGPPGASRAAVHPGRLLGAIRDSDWLRSSTSGSTSCRSRRASWRRSPARRSSRRSTAAPTTPTTCGPPFVRLDRLIRLVGSLAAAVGRRDHRGHRADRGLRRRGSSDVRVGAPSSAMAPTSSCSGRRIAVATVPSTSAPTSSSSARSPRGRASSVAIEAAGRPEWPLGVDLVDRRRWPRTRPRPSRGVR